MPKNGAEKGLKKCKTKKRFSVIGGVWWHKKDGTGVEYLKIQIQVQDQLVNLTAWPNQRKNHPQGPDLLVYAQELCD